MVLNFGLFSSMFPESAATGEGMGADYTQRVIQDNGTFPLGAVCAWLKTLNPALVLIPNWVECNGQTLNDPDSIYNGLVIPNLNGSGGGANKKRFLRGSTTSGTTGGNDSIDTGTADRQIPVSSGSGLYAAPTTHLHTGLNILPSYYEVVWVMKIK